MLVFFHPFFFCDTWGFFQFVHTCIYKYTYHSSRDTENTPYSHFPKFAIYMLFEETDTEESRDSQSDVSSLDDGFSRMQFESSSSEKQVTDDDDDDADSQVWGEIESESDTEFSEDYGMTEEVPANSEDSTINPIDCYRHFITNEIISLMVREINRYAEQHVQRQKQGGQIF